MKRQKGNALVIAVVGISLVCALFYGMFQLKRWWNYKWGYQNQVSETICEMVKPEYLINPEDCK